MMTKSTKFNIISCLLIISIGFAVYINCLNNTFVWDDALWIENNDYIKNFRLIGEVFTKDILSEVGRQFNYYRPLQAVSLMIDYNNSGLNPVGYHLSNVIIHILVGLTLFYLLNLLFETKVLSLIASLLFIVHPIHTGAVSYISGRADPLSALFLILSFILYIKFKEIRKIIFYLFSLAFFVLAVLSKESALIYPVFLYIYERGTFSFKKSRKPKLAIYLPFIIILACYFIFRFFFLSLPLSITSANVSLINRIPATFKAVTDYLRLFIFPFNLHLEYGYPLVNYLSLGVIFGLLIVISSLIYAFKTRGKNKIIFFSIVWFYVYFIPVSNIYPLNVYMAEHWMYVPSIGIFVILAYIVTLLMKKGEVFRILGCTLIIFLLGFFSFLTIRQNDSYWRDAITFYKRTIELSPFSFKAHNNLANIYFDMGLYRKAESEYKKTIEIKPDFAFAYHNLGLIYYEEGLYDKAIEKYQKAIQLKTDYLQAYNNLGNAYFKSSLFDEAKDAYEKALKLNPGHIKALNNLGLLYYEKGNREKARELWLKTLRIDPNYKPASNNLKRFFKAHN